MKSNLGTAYNAAKLLAMNRTDSEIPVSIFPPNYEVLRIIATETFTKVRFPITHQRLWERALELVAQTRMTVSRREMWLADASLALGDAKGEISHLRIALLSEPNNARLHFRLASRLLDAADSSTEEEALKQVREVIKRLRKMDSTSDDAKVLENRANNR